VHRLILLCHGPVASGSRMAFPLDEPLDDGARTALARLSTRLPRVDRVLTGPSLRSRQTADMLGLDARQEPALDDLDLGRWRGRTLREIEAAEPQAVGLWLTDASAAPHGGESRSTLLSRVKGWLATLESEPGSTLAVTHAAVIRSVVLIALDAPPAAFWRIDVEPLSLSDLRLNERRWTIRGLNLVGGRGDSH
jgi:broad specificity phosphatase PhoE